MVHVMHLYFPILITEDALSALPETIYAILTGIPYNIWPWLLLITVPCLIFSTVPGDSAFLRLRRIILAIIIGYVCVNLTLHTHRAQQRAAFEQCKHELYQRGGNPEQAGECMHLVNIADGASYVFYFVLGWVPAAGYTGFWELLWRWKYRGKITNKGRWFSTALIVCSIPVWIVIGAVFVTYIYSRLNCHPAIVASGKCWV